MKELEDMLDVRLGMLAREYQTIRLLKWPDDQEQDIQKSGECRKLLFQAQPVECWHTLGNEEDCNVTA